MSEKKIITANCFMCLYSCKIDYHIENEKIFKVKGSFEPPNYGALCARAYAEPEVIYAPDRVKYPLKRVGKKGENKWERISWDEALTIVANKLNEIKKKYGPEAVAFHRGMGRGDLDVREFFLRLANAFGSPNICGPAHICFTPRGWASCLTFGYSFKSQFPDIEKTECIVLWGNNAPHSNILMITKPIYDAKERGAKLIVVDPRYEPLARIADKHVMVRPGTDGALALGLINVLIEEDLYDKEFVKNWTVGFDELRGLAKKYPAEEVEKITWISAESIREVGRIIATSKSATILIGTAMDHLTNSIQTIRAIMFLIALTGNVDIPGGHVIYPWWTNIFFDHNEVLAGREFLPPEIVAKTIGIDKHPLIRKINIPCGDIMDAYSPSIYAAMRTDKPYPVKAIVIRGANPVITESNSNAIIESLKKAEMVVVLDMFMTSTTKYADIILPVCTDIERDWYIGTPSSIKLQSRIIEPIGESWPDVKIITELAKRLGLEKYFPWKTIEEAINARLEGIGITYEQLLKSPSTIVFPLPEIKYKKYESIGFPEYSKKYKHINDVEKKDIMRGFPTSSGKVEFYSETLKRYGHDPLPTFIEPAESPVSTPEIAEKYPLILITGAQLNIFTHSMFRNISLLHELMPENVLEIHPETAEKLRIKDGNMVLVESPRGSIRIKASVTEGIEPRVVHMHKGFSDQNCNILIDSQAYEPIIGSTGINASLCRVTNKEE